MKEIPLKQWVIDEAQRRKVSLSAVYQDIQRGKYNLALRRVNKRVIFVQLSDEIPRPQNQKET